MKLSDFYKLLKEKKDEDYGILVEKLEKDLTEFVGGFKFNHAILAVGGSIPEGESPTMFVLDIATTDVTPSPPAEGQERKLITTFQCLIRIVVTKEKKIRISSKLRGKISDGNSFFRERYIEFIRGHLELMGSNVEVK